MNETEGINYYALFFRSAAVTVGLESLVLFLVVRFYFKLSRQKMPNSLLLIAGVFASAGTLPWLWFVLPGVLRPYWLFVTVGELLVWAAEAVFYQGVLRIGWSRSALLSLVCNVASYISGLALH